MTTKTTESRSYVKYRVPFELIIDEITVALRNNITDRQSRAVSFTDTFTGDGSTTKFELTNDRDSKDRHTANNIKSVTIAGVTKTQWEDYLVKYRSDDDYFGYITFPNPPADDAAIIVKGDKQYTMVVQEYPRIDLTPNNYPKISIQLGQAIGKEQDIKYDWDMINLPVVITVVDTGRNYTDNLGREVWQYMKKNRRNFKFFDFIIEPQMSPFSENIDDMNSMSFFISLDFLITDLWERS